MAPAHDKVLRGFGGVRPGVHQVFGGELLEDEGADAQVRHLAVPVPFVVLLELRDVPDLRLIDVIQPEVDGVGPDVVPMGRGNDKQLPVLQRPYEIAVRQEHARRAPVSVSR
jgi:hypothetical protein